jgi:hypothetical protein
VPFLRVIRDKRGYETTFLMHWYREGARQRSRILYVFRSPGGVRVGREALEPDVLREIEGRHPDIEFDWKSVLGNRQIVDTTPEVRRPRKRRRDEEQPAAEAAPAPPAQEKRVREPAAPVAARPLIPSALEGATQEEQVAFVAHWYPLLRDRVSARASDPARRDALLALAERLNPAAWTDPDQIATGLQQAGDALERLSRVFARRRRRPRRVKPAEPQPATE